MRSWPERGSVSGAGSIPAWPSASARRWFASDTPTSNRPAIVSPPPVETLGQQSGLAANGNAAGRRQQVPDEEVQQQGFADTVLTDKSRAFLIETEVQV